MVTVPECTYGLDVIAQIGWWRDREHLNRQQIHQRLEEYGVQIGEREIDHLYARYQVLLGCTERLDAIPVNEFHTHVESWTADHRGLFSTRFRAFRALFGWKKLTVCRSWVKSPVKLCPS